MISKKERIWREILERVLQNKTRQFTQKELAEYFGFSLSTIFNALKLPRKTKTIKVAGNYFEVINPEKLLYIWATFRNLEKDIIYQTQVDMPALEIEKHLPAEAILGAYSAYQEKFKDAPADYDKVYIYAKELSEIQKRFPEKKGYPNLIVLQADLDLKKMSLAQIFADIWNLEDWYAYDFYLALKEKINAILAGTNN